MSDIKKVISQRLVSHQDRTGKKTSMVDIFSALRKNNDARMLRHTRLDDKHSTIYVTNNENGYKVYEKKGKGKKVTKKVYKVGNKNKLKKVFNKSAEEMKNNFGKGVTKEIETIKTQDKNNLELFDNHIQNEVHNNHNEEQYQEHNQLIMENLEKNIPEVKAPKRKKRRNKKNKNKGKKEEIVQVETNKEKNKEKKNEKNHTKKKRKRNRNKKRSKKRKY